jgi:hypothetical protein
LEAAPLNAAEPLGAEPPAEVEARAATSSSRVDLPMPGSPASSTTAPGTMPPPSTRSSSSRPVGLLLEERTSTWPIGRAGALTAPAATTRAGLAEPASMTVPQTWHSPQRPIHLEVCHPHSVQR